MREREEGNKKKKTKKERRRLFPGFEGDEVSVIKENARKREGRDHS